MAQNELMLRLLKDGKKVGYIRLCPLKGAFYKKINDSDYDFTGADINFIMAEVCDAFEIGIKVNNDWFFGTIHLT